MATKRFIVKLEIPSTTTVELEVEAENPFQAREYAHDYCGEGSAFIKNEVEGCESSDQEFGERRIVSCEEKKQD